MNRPLRPLRPAHTAPASASVGHSQLNHSKEPARKRTNISVACNACRKRKNKCDGVKPNCVACRLRKTECIYEMGTGYMKNAELQAQKRRLEKELGSALEVFEHLQQSSAEKALEILDQIRGGADLASVFSRIKLDHEDQLDGDSLIDPVSLLSERTFSRPPSSHRSPFPARRSSFPSELDSLEEDAARLHNGEPHPARVIVLLQQEDEIASRCWLSSSELYVSCASTLYVAVQRVLWDHQQQNLAESIMEAQRRCQILTLCGERDLVARKLGEVMSVYCEQLTIINHEQTEFESIFQPQPPRGALPPVDYLFRLRSGDSDLHHMAFELNHIICTPLSSHANGLLPTLTDNDSQDLFEPDLPDTIVCVRETKSGIHLEWTREISFRSYSNLELLDVHDHNLQNDFILEIAQEVDHPPFSAAGTNGAWTPMHAVDSLDELELEILHNVHGSADMTETFLPRPTQ